MILIVGLGLIFFLYIPNRLADSSYIRKQKTCQEQVGYASDADDSSESATVESQQAYRKCLSPNN